MPSYLFERVSQFVATIFPLATVDWNDHLSDDDVHDAALRACAAAVPAPSALPLALPHALRARARSRRWDRCSASAELAHDASAPPDLARAKLRLRLLREQRAELRATVDALTHRLAAKEQQLAQLSRHAADLPPDVARAHHELECMRSTVAALERHNSDLLYRSDYDMAAAFDASKQLALQQNSFSSRITALKLDLDHMYTERDRLAERVQQLENRLLDSDVERCMLSIVSAERDQLEERLQQASAAERFSIAAENVRLKMHAELTDTKRRLETVTKKLLEAWHQKKQLSLEVESRLHNEASMLQMFGDLKKECQRLREERDLAAQHAQQMQQALQDAEEKAHNYQSVCEERDQSIQRADHLQNAYTELANILGCSSVPTHQMDAKQLGSIVNGARFRVQQSEIERQSTAELVAMRETELERLHKQLRKERDARAKAERRVERIASKHTQLASAIGHSECPLDADTGLADIYPHVRRLGELTTSQQQSILKLKEQLAGREAEAQTNALEVEKLKQVRRRIKTEASDLTHSVHSLEAEIAALSRENSAMKSTLQSTEQESNQYEGLSEVLRLEKERNAANVRAHGVELAHLRSQIAEKDVELEKNASEVERVHKLVADLERACTALQAEKDELDAQVRKKSEADDLLTAQLEGAQAQVQQLGAECAALKAEVDEQRRIVAEEREDLAKQLADRTANFAKVEAELNDARSTYIEAADNFETQRAALTKRLAAAQREKLELKSILAAMNCSSEQDSENCTQRLGDRSRSTSSDEDGTCNSLRSDACSMTSALTATSAASDDTLGHRVQQLQGLLQEETRVKEDKSKRLHEAEVSLKEMCAEMERMKVLAKEKEREAEGMRSEMKSIHSRMRKMAHVSMPRDYEKWLEDDDEDMERLQQVREASRKERDVDRRSKGRRKSKGLALENKGR